MAAEALSDNGGLGGERQLIFDANKTDKSDMVTIQIDLTDPQDLMQKLELIDLTDEETDILIGKAMELNKELRKLEKQNVAKEFRSFTISAPAFHRNTRLPHSGVLIPGSPRMSYRDNGLFGMNSLARLQSSNSNAGMSRASQSVAPLKGISYSYHSARPMRLTVS